MIILVDFGGQTAHLIGRRVRELGVDCLMVSPDEALDKIRSFGLRPQDDRGVDGIIFSGGPASVYDEDSPTIDKKIFELGIPILGICYGLQLTAQLLGGEVKAGFIQEFGPAELYIKKSSNLLQGVPNDSTVWMSHGDEVIKPPPGFMTNAGTATIENAVISNQQNKIYGIQFHPEVVHSEFGENILENFLKVCGIKIKKLVIDKKFVESIIQDIKDSLVNEKAICALSGGVDSSVAAVLVHHAIGQNLTSIYIDSGLMRQDETDLLKKVFETHYKQSFPSLRERKMQVKIIDAKDKFLNGLKGIINPEEKRKAIGKTFIEVFEDIAKTSGAKFLVQGTIYPDVIESAGTKHAKVMSIPSSKTGVSSSHAVRIKSHHNVGGLPSKMNLVLIEPLRNFYKDEVRRIGKILRLPDEIINRQPFPGPGLAIRIIGEVDDKKLDILRRSDKIVQEEIEKSEYSGKLWQAFAILTGIKTTGVRGDNRAYGETIAIRAIEAQDAMSANFARLPFTLLDKISTRIVNEIPEVNRVVYDITNKPPATMEWE